MRRTCCMLLLLGLLPTAAWAQGKAGSVVVVGKSSTDRPAGPGEASDEATAAAHYLETQVAIDLDRLCVRSITDQDLRDLLGYEKARELLGSDTGGKALAAAAEAQGAQYVVTVSASEKGGEMSLSASLTNAANGQTMARERVTTPVGPGEADAVESLAKQFVDKLSSLTNFDTGCEPHWSGSITWEDREEAGNQKSDRILGGQAADGQREEMLSTVTYTWKIDDVVEVVLMPMSLGSQGPNSPKAKFVRNFRNQDISSTKSSGRVFCRYPGKDPALYGYSEESGYTYDAQGKNSWKHPVDVTVEGDGSYRIEAELESAPYTWKRSTKEPGSGCPPESPGEIITTGSDVRAAPAFSISGKVDPKRPDTLAGQKVVTIDASTLPAENGKGTITVTWNLKFVKPKKKK